MQDKINKAIKFREGYRPFAPAVLDEFAETIFQLDKNKIRKREFRIENIEYTVWLCFVILKSLIDQNGGAHSSH